MLSEHTTLNTALKVRGKVSVMGFVLSDCAVVWSTGNVNMPWPYLDLGQDDDYRHELYVKHNPIFLYRTKLYGNQVSQTGCTVVQGVGRDHNFFLLSRCVGHLVTCY